VCARTRKSTPTSPHQQPGVSGAPVLSSTPHHLGVERLNMCST
jgi:hypothetical protein